MKKLVAYAGHTPAPWQAKPETDYVPAQVWADGRQLTEVYGESKVARRANAQLIADAPELLRHRNMLFDALLLILPLAESYLSKAPTDPDNAKLETARAALREWSPT